MYTRNLPGYLARALAPPRLAAGVLFTLALLSAACSDQASRMTSPPLLSVSALPAGFTLGTAATFAALGGTGVTCTMPNPGLPAITVGGDVGSLSVAPTTVTGFPGFTPGANPCSLSGTVQLGTAAAFFDFSTAFTTLAAIPCPTDAQHNLSGDLIGMSLTPGVYCMSGVVLLTGQLTLSGGGANDTWIFVSGTPTTSLTPIGGSVVMAGSGNTCNVYWQIATAASLDNTQFIGNMLAGTAITFTGTSSSLAGRALAGSDVTMTGASITGCVAGNGNGNGNGHDNDHGKGNDKEKCNQGVGNGREGCDPGNSDHRHGSNDENGGKPGDPGRRGGH